MCRMILFVFGVADLRRIVLPFLVAVLINGGVLLLLPFVGKTVGRIIRVSMPQPLVVESYERRSTEAPEVVRELPEPEPHRQKPEKKTVYRVVEPVKLDKIVRIGAEGRRFIKGPLKLGFRIEPRLGHLEGVGVSEGLPEGEPEGGIPRGSGKEFFEPPMLLHSVRPHYPRWAAEQGLQGRVLLRMLVDERGMVERVEIVRSSGYGVLDTAAVSAVKSYRFKPAKKSGKSVKVYVEQEIIFKIE